MRRVEQDEIGGGVCGCAGDGAGAAALGRSDIMAKLGQQTGGDGKDRVREARQIIDMVRDHLDALSPKEVRFIESIADSLDRWGDFTAISGRQIFWLRDIKDKVTA